MGKRKGAVTYLYWSQRRVERFMNDNRIAVRKYKVRVSLPVIPGLPAPIDYEKDREGDKRPELARKIESRLGLSAVTAFNGPPPIKYAKGTGSVIFGELASAGEGEQKPALIFTSCDYNGADTNSVAVCLFGSIENFEGAVQAAGPVLTNGRGWRSSAAPYIFELLQGRGRNDSAVALAVDALKIAGQQGCDTDEEMPFSFVRPWLREFTYGDLQNSAEWLAEIYLDVDFGDWPINIPPRKWGFRRVLVGAPFWIRTRRPEAMRLYTKHGPNFFGTVPSPGTDR